MVLKYNKDDTLVSSMVAAYGSQVFDQSGGQDWALASNETYSQFFDRVASQLYDE